jgi:hypothetical protein
MNHVFVVFDNSGTIGPELVGVFSTEDKADRACLTDNHVMWAMPIDVPEHRPNVQGNDFPYGYKIPRIPYVSSNYINPTEEEQAK